MDLCIECQNVVNERDQAVQCEECELWQHLNCGTGITLSEFQATVESGEGIEWVCGPCLQAVNEDPVDQVSNNNISHHSFRYNN